ncbi:hypothetical protein ACS0TY_002312 [Phlomoides rotata]
MKVVLPLETLRQYVSASRDVFVLRAKKDPLTRLNILPVFHFRWSNSCDRGNLNHGTYNFNNRKTNNVTMASNGNNSINPNTTATSALSVKEAGQTFVPQVVVLPYVPSKTRPFVVQSEKFRKFSSNNFKRWQQKMLFYLTILHLIRFLWEDPSVVDKNDTDMIRRVAYD